MPCMTSGNFFHNEIVWFCGVFKRFYCAIRFTARWPWAHSVFMVKLRELTSTSLCLSPLFDLFISESTLIFLLIRFFHL